MTEDVAQIGDDRTPVRDDDDASLFVFCDDDFESGSYTALKSAVRLHSVSTGLRTVHDQLRELLIRLLVGQTLEWTAVELPQVGVFPGDDFDLIGDDVGGFDGPAQRARVECGDVRIVLETFLRPEEL